MERTCKKCGETKPIEEFVKAKGCKDGISFCCKKCRDVAKRIHYESNKKIYMQKAKEYNENNKSKIEKIRELWYKSNPGKAYINRKREYDKEYYRQNKDRLRKYSTNWIKSHYYINGINKYSELYRKNNKQIIHKHINELADCYIIELLSRSTNIDRGAIKRYPELIENWRQQIKVKRLLKSKKNENTKTS